MSATTKCLGFIAGLSAVAAIGVAVAQGVPPNPLITNPPIAAGQQSSQHTSMGETGVPALIDPIQTAIIVRQPEVAYVAPAPVAVIEPAPTVSMGAGPAPEPMPAPKPMRIKRDRN